MVFRKNSYLFLKTADYLLGSYLARSLQKNKKFFSIDNCIKNLNVTDKDLSFGKVPPGPSPRNPCTSNDFGNWHYQQEKGHLSLAS